MSPSSNLSLGGGIGFTKRPKALDVSKRYLILLVAVVILVIVALTYPTVDITTSGGKINTSLLGSSLSQKPGYTVNGTKCGPGIRQVSWSKYSPYCIPIFRGNNGGATSPGVDSKSITITYREPNTAGHGRNGETFWF